MNQRNEIDTQKKSIKNGMKYLWQNCNFVVIFLVIFIAYLIINGSATNWAAITNIMRHSSIIGIVALAMSLVILIGDIDLSVGSSIAFVGGFAVLVFNHTGSLVLTILFGIVAGAFVGLVNGVLIGKVKMPAFIATLATMMMYRSISQYYLSSTGVSMYQIDSSAAGYDTFFSLGNGNIITIPILTLIFVVIALVLIYISNNTKFGKTIYAIGSNEKAAKLSGINTERVRILVFTIAGCLIGLAAVLFAAQNGTITPASAGKNYELYAIAAVVIGGISMSGGKGKIFGVIFGMLTFTIIDKIILSIGLNPLINDTIKGIILLIAIMIQMAQKGTTKDR